MIKKYDNYLTKTENSADIFTPKNQNAKENIRDNDQIS